MALKLVFMGTPAFAVPSLTALVDAGHDVVCVYTQPPRRAGRGKKLMPTAVHTAADGLGIGVRAPVSLRLEEEQEAFRALDADVAVVVAYGLILPGPVLEAPRLGCLNIHASLLPRWRGAAPIQRAIMAGDAETGISIMVLDEGLDTGPVLLRQAISVASDETAGTLHDRLAGLGAGLIVEALAGHAGGTLVARMQPEEGVTYAAKLEAADEEIDWTRSASELDRQIRALAPRPGAWFRFGEERIKVFACTVRSGGAGETGEIGEPGEIIDDTLSVACGEGVLRLDRLQRAGRKAMDAMTFLRGQPLPRGTRLG